MGAIYRQWRITGRQAQAHGPSGRRRAIRGRLSIWTVDLSPTVQLGGLTMLDRYQDQLAPSPERRDGGAGSKGHGGQPMPAVRADPTPVTTLDGSDRLFLAMEAPETRYVAVGDADVAYQVVGEGPIDLLYCSGLGGHIELSWDIPVTAEFLTRLAAFSRLILIDRRGTGASDALSRNAMPTWEEWTEDIVAVLDAVGSKRTAILASLDAGPIAILFTAMHPEIVSTLILHNTSARYMVADDYPIGEASEAIDTLIEVVATGWGPRTSFGWPTRAWPMIRTPFAHTQKWLVPR